MKKLFILIIVVLCTACCTTRSYNEYRTLYEQQERLIQCYENALDSIYKEDDNLFLDVYMETDWYLDYTIEYNKYLDMKKQFNK